MSVTSEWFSCYLKIGWKSNFSSEVRLESNNVHTIAMSCLTKTPVTRQNVIFKAGRYSGAETSINQNFSSFEYTLSDQ